MTDSRDVSRHFADLVVDTTYEGLGPAAAEAAKKSVLDTVGVALAASGMEPASRAALDVIGEAGGRAEATALGCKRRVPAMMAAFANGALAHGLDFDDQTPWGQHASSSVVPAVLAVAERRGGISGSELVTAVAVGQDIFARLRCHVGVAQGLEPVQRLRRPRRGGCGVPGDRTLAGRGAPRPGDREPAVLRDHGGGGGDG